MAQGDRLVVLIVEDGSEYLENLERFVPGPEYLQARCAREALDVLRSRRADLLYLDMRFDRIPLDRLVGDHAEATQIGNGDPAQGWKHIQDNQGLYILDFLARNGFGDLPAVLAYDFSREQRRLRHLSRIHPRLAWVSDAATPEEIRQAMLRART